jgi:GT2 family glycosyltransferase
MIRDVGIVTVNHFHGHELLALVNSVLRPRPGASFRYVIVNNTPTDPAFPSSELAGYDVEVISNAAPLGFASNVCQGVAALGLVRHLLLLNPDVICEPHLIDRMVARMDSPDFQDVGILAPRLTNPDGSLQYSCRAFSTPWTLFARGLRLDRYVPFLPGLKSYLLSDWDHATERDVDWVTGAVMMVRSEAAGDVGPMDTDYFLYSEDQDWCCRMWRRGWRVRYVPQLVAKHGYRREGINRPGSSASRHQLISAIRMFLKFQGRLTRTAS